ncbi:zinc finger protein [Nephila pilipes]|uniref:Zinc finger protein n=1 Tax=Nephila pilipes TaxID=299642 RepID=A0A8X6MAB8_NEPPI|nr:zinc finger protein [Nephila pilipes]
MSVDPFSDLVCTYEDIIKKTTKHRKSSISVPVAARQTASGEEKCKSKGRFSCELCGRDYINKTGLTNHYLVHSQVKPFKCDICDKAFTKKCTLTAHLLIHSAVRPHVCDICSRPFARKNDLKKHKLVHTNEKYHTCNICKAEFKYINSLRKHTKKHVAKESEGEKVDVKKNEILKNICAQASVLTKSYDKKASILDNGKVLKDTYNIKSSKKVSRSKKKSEKASVFPIDKNEKIVSSKSEVIIDEIKTMKNLETLNSNIVSDAENITQCCNIKQVIEDDSNSLSEIRIHNEVFAFETEKMNEEIQNKFLSDKFNSIFSEIDANGLEVLKTDGKRKNTLQSPELDIDKNDIISNNSKVEQMVMIGANDNIFMDNPELNDHYGSVNNCQLEQELANLNDNILNNSGKEQKIMINMRDSFFNNSEIELEIMTNLNKSILDNSEVMMNLNESILNNTKAEQEIMTNMNENILHNSEVEQELMINMNESILNDSEMELEIMTNLNDSILNQSEMEQEIITKLNDSVSSEMEQEIMANLNETIQNNSAMELEVIANLNDSVHNNSGMEQEILANLNDNVLNNSEIEREMIKNLDDDLNDPEIEQEIMANLNDDLNNSELEQEVMVNLTDVDLNSSEIEQELMANLNDDLNNPEIEKEIMANLNNDLNSPEIEQELMANLNTDFNNPDIEQKIMANFNDDTLNNPEIEQEITNFNDDEHNDSELEQDIISNHYDDDINNDSEIELEIMMDENDNLFINNSEIEFQLMVDENDNVFINNSEIEKEIDKENELSLFMESNFVISEDGCDITNEMLDNISDEISINKKRSMTPDDPKTLNNDVHTLFPCDPLINEGNNLFDDEEFFSCDICDKLFNDQTSLLTHISKHTNEDLWKCYVCDANFDCSDELQLHISSHSDIPIKDVDKIIDEGIEADFIKFEHLTLDEISIDEIDNIDSDDDSEGKVEDPQVENSFKDNSTNEENTENDTYEESAVSYKDEAKINQMEDELEIEDSDLLLEISKLNIDKISFNSIFNGKNFNLRDLEILYESDDDDDLDFSNSNKILIQGNGINENSLRKTIQDIVTKLNCDSSSECSDDFVDLSDTDIPLDNELLEEYLILNDVANIHDLPIIDNLAENLKQIVSSDIAIKTVHPSLQINTPYNCDEIGLEDDFNTTTTNTNVSVESKKNISNKIISNNVGTKTNSSIKVIKKHVCPICEKTYRKKLYLKGHYLTHLEIVLLSHIRVHIKQAAEENNINLSSELRSYLKSLADKLHICETCGFRFSRRDRWVKHMQTHREKKFLCEKCGSTYESRTEFQTHVLNHTDTSLEDFGYNLENLGNVDYLDVTNLEPSFQNLDKTYTCLQCLKVFKRRSEFHDHYLIHRKEKPHKCVICLKSFRQHSTLKRHILTHSGTKPFTCDLCEKSFSWRSSLLKHRDAKHSQND